MTAKNVWYISKYANILKYGAETRQASFCKEFAKAGYDVTLITSNSSHLFDTLPKFKGRYLEENYNEVDVVWVGTLQYSAATSLRRVLSWFWFELFVVLLPVLKKYEKPDVVIASSLSILSVLSGCFFKYFYEAKFIFEVRDIWPQTLIDLKGLSKKHPLVSFLGWVERIGYKYADQIVGTMPGIGLHVESVIGESSKVHFIPQGVSFDFYRSVQESVSVDYLEKYWPKNKWVATYAGTLGAANALNYIIDAAELLEARNSGIHFVIMGSGGEECNLRRQAMSLSNVTFLPRVKKEHVQSILKRSDVLLASVKNEKVYKFGVSLNKFIDYMYAKKPIICMFSGYPSMINEANCGEFTPSEEPQALAECLIRYNAMTPDVLRQLGQNGYDFLVEQRSFGVLSKKYMALFHD